MVGTQKARMHAGESHSRRDVISKTGGALAASLLLSSSITTGAAHALFEKVGIEELLKNIAMPNPKHELKNSPFTIVL